MRTAGLSLALLVVAAVLTWVVVSDNGPDSRPPSEVGVFVLNATGVPGADVQAVVRLTRAGYEVVGAGSASWTQIGTTTACREGLEKEAFELTRKKVIDLGDATIAAFPIPPPGLPKIDQADCLLTVGRRCFEGGSCHPVADL